MRHHKVVIFLIAKATLEAAGHGQSVKSVCLSHFSISYQKVRLQHYDIEPSVDALVYLAICLAGQTTDGGGVGPHYWDVTPQSW